MKKNFLFTCLALLCVFGLQYVHAQDTSPVTHFTNPIEKVADPWITKHDGNYYMILVGGKNGNALTVTKSKTLTEP